LKVILFIQSKKILMLVQLA